MPIQKTIAVLANPYLHIDHEGEPAGACPCDPIEHTPARAWVGAKLDLERTKITEAFARGEARDSRQRTVFAFDAGVVTLPITNYYLQRIQHGELIAADEKTARAAGVAFVDPVKALAVKRADAFDAYRSAYDEDPAFARVAAAPTVQAPTKAIKASAAQAGEETSK